MGGYIHVLKGYIYMVHVHELCREGEGGGERGWGMGGYIHVLNEYTCTCA